MVPPTVRRLVEQGRIMASDHFHREQEISIFDAEHAILNAYYCEKQRDELRQARYKYIIYGDSLAGSPIAVVGKVVTLEERVFFIITAYFLRN